MISQDGAFPCPYKSYADHAYWSRSVAARPADQIDPIVRVPFKLDRQMRIATAGSCFAQHIARYLQQSGYNYFVTEKAPKFISSHLARRYNYGTFSARFANIYTVRQLLQLFQRAHGAFEPVESHWLDGSSFVDPFRPAIQPGGFQTLDFLLRDREQHFAAVRRMFSECGVFIFTLGLTEAWRHKQDGAVYPLCPGCGAGSFDPDRYEFHNADYEEILADLRQVLQLFRKVNPKGRMILTVSPVPLIATASGEHVLAATTYSKSVLRAVAGKLATESDHVAYFPSYEIITTPATQGRYFAADLRGITDAGVRHVMRVFFSHFTDGVFAENDSGARPSSTGPACSAAEAAAGVICDEEILETIRSGAQS